MPSPMVTVGTSPTERPPMLLYLLYRLFNLDILLETRNDTDGQYPYGPLKSFLQFGARRSESRTDLMVWGFGLHATISTPPEGHTVKMPDYLRALAGLFGHDLFIEREALSRGPFRFSSETSLRGDREFWALGLHVVVSPLQMTPQR
jgi:hypothetical protein